MAFCTNCGTPLGEGDLFCMNCGEKVWDGEKDVASANGEGSQPEMDVAPLAEAENTADANETRTVLADESASGVPTDEVGASEAIEEPADAEAGELGAVGTTDGAGEAEERETAGEPSASETPSTPDAPSAPGEPGEPEASETVESLNASTQFDATRFVADEEVDFGPSTAMNSGPFGSGPGIASFYGPGPHSGPGASGAFAAVAGAGQQHSDTAFANGQPGEFASVQPGSGTGTTAPLASGTTAATANGLPASNKIIIGVSAIVAIVAIAIAVFVLGSRATPSNETATSETSETPTYTVQFETGGGSEVASRRVEEGNSLTSPEDPTKDGYTFEGWYYDEKFKNEAKFPLDDLDENTTLYAKWEETESDEGTQGASTSTGRTGSTPPTAKTTTTTNQQPAQDVVTLTIHGTDGTSRTGEIRREGNSQRVFADSNSRYLSDSEIYALSDIEKCVAWNEIVAASNGYSFRNGDLAAYFNSCSWYSPNPYADAGGGLTAGSNAQANIDRLQAACDDWFRYKLT